MKAAATRYNRYVDLFGKDDYSPAQIENLVKNDHLKPNSKRLGLQGREPSKKSKIPKKPT